MNTFTMKYPDFFRYYPILPGHYNPKKFSGRVLSLDPQVVVKKSLEPQGPDSQTKTGLPHPLRKFLKSLKSL